MKIFFWKTLVKEYNSKLPKFKKDLDTIYQTYYLPNVSDWLESEWPALYLDGIPVPKPLEITTYSGVHVSSNKGFGTKATAVAPGMVQLALPLVARAILLDLGIKASAINPVVGGSIIVVTLTLPVAIDLMNRVADDAVQKNLITNMPPIPIGDWLKVRPVNAHHIIPQRPSILADTRQRVFEEKCKDYFPGGVDDEKNGVWLTKEAHGTAKGSQNIHTKNYYDYIKFVIDKALKKTDPCIEVDKELNKIRRELENYDRARNHPKDKIREANQNKFNKEKTPPTRDQLKWEK